MPARQTKSTASRRSGRAGPRAPAGRDIVERIEQGTFQPIYVLAGPDLDASDAIIAALRAKVLTPGLEAFDFDVFDADDFREENFVQRLRQAPIGARRLVVIRGVTRMGRDRVVFCGLQKKGTEELCRAVAKAPDTTIVVLTGRESADLFEVLGRAGIAKYAVDLGLPEEDELAALVSSWAKKSNFELAPEAVRMLLSVSGNDTTTLRNEVEKLATAVEPGTRVGPETVRDIAGSSRAFDLADYVRLVLLRRPASAMLVLRRLEQAGEGAPGIIAWLTGALLDVVRYRAERSAPGGEYRTRYLKDRLGGADARWNNETELNLLLQQLYRVQKAMLEGRQEVFARLELFTYCAGCVPGKTACGLHTDGAHWSSCPRSATRRVKR